jgi:hypothetical protein
MGTRYRRHLVGFLKEDTWPIASFSAARCVRLPGPSRKAVRGTTREELLNRLAAGPRRPAPPQRAAKPGANTAADAFLAPADSATAKCRKACATTRWPR